MPNSPDFRNLSDLTIYDKSQQTIFEQALDEATTEVPEWTPREGNIEVIMLEAMAFIAAEQIYAINRIPSSVVEIILQLMGVYRDLGRQPVVDLRFTVYGDEGYTINAGTRVIHELDEGIEPVVYTTDADLVIPSGQTTGTISATGDRYTDDVNTALAYTGLALYDINTVIDNVQFVQVTTFGIDEEDDIEWVIRGSQEFGYLSLGLVTPDQYAAFVLSYPTINRCKVLDNYNPAASGNPSPGSNPGYVNVVVYGDDGVVSDDDKADVMLGINGRKAAMLNVSLSNPTIVPIDIDVSINVEKGYEPTLAVQNVKDLLGATFSVDTWDWSRTVTRNWLIGLIGSAEGVSFVQSLTNPSVDITSPAFAPLFVYDTANSTVTVNS